MIGKFLALKEQFGHLGQGWAVFSAKGQRVNICHFVGHVVCVTTAQLYYIARGAIENT